MSEHENKMFGLQMQVRQNQQEIMEYVKELDGWEDEIKQKEEQLKTKTDPVEQNLPPVRNSLLKKKKKKVRKQKETDTKDETKRIPGHDYRSWDKFDVDKACAEVDNQSPSSSSEYETDEEWEEQRRKRRAEELKEQGNTRFKAGKYDEAIECYSQGIDVDSENAILFANRAMALLKLQKHAAAEVDCTEALIRDPTYIKAMSRRATARIALKKFREAREDYSQILKLEPGNKFAKSELEAINKLLNPVPELAANHEISEIGIVKPIYKAPADRSKKPLRRITIEEIGVEETEESRQFKKKLENENRGVNRRDLETFDTKFAAPSSTTDRPPSSNAGKISADILERQKMGGEPASSTTPRDLRESPSTGEGDVVSQKMEEIPNNKTDKSSAGVPLKISQQTVFAVPSVSFQFQADWKTLRNQSENFYIYLKQIDPTSYQRIFGEALDADMLSKILETLKNFYLRDGLDVFPVLEQLSTVKRFAMNIMFLSAKDKNVLKELFQHLLSSDRYDSSTVVSLKKSYDL